MNINLFVTRHFLQLRKQGKGLSNFQYVGCPRISSRTVFETENDVNSNQFRIRKLCLRFLIRIIRDIQNLQSAWVMCRKMLESWPHFYTSLMMFMLKHCNHQCSSQSKTVKLKLKLKVLFKTKLIGRNHSLKKINYNYNL